MQTDAFIQDILKKRFSDTTIITIAHRLNTIADYDKVIVMQTGNIIEEGHPYELIEKQGSFFGMVQHTGKNAPLITEKAREHYESKHKGKNKKNE